MKYNQINYLPGVVCCWEGVPKLKLELWPPVEGVPKLNDILNVLNDFLLILWIEIIYFN